MQVKINEGCIGCGLCVAGCPAVFSMGEEGTAQVIAQPTAEKFDEVKDAAANCPVGVIEAEEG